MKARLRWGGAVATSLLLLLGGCGHQAQRDLRKSSKALSKAVARGDVDEIRRSAVPGARAGVDTAAMVSPAAKKAWAKTLRNPEHIAPEALMFVGEDMPVRVVWGEDGWRFAEDPGDVYAQDTPRHALRALVTASRNERWGVLLGLAPKRYRMGLSADELAKAWTDGEHAAVLTEARDEVAAHLADAIQRDAHEAVLEIAPRHVVRLEREGERWVVVDFLPNPGQ